jgi:hypothetical protein
MKEETMHLQRFFATIELERKEAILAKLKVKDDMEDLDELADLETKLLGSIDRSRMEMGLLPP